MNPEVMSFFEEFLGKDWEKQLEEDIAISTLNPMSLKRTVLSSIALLGLDYGRLPKSLVREVVGLEEEIGSVFPKDFYHHVVRVGPSREVHLALSVSWGAGGVWTLTQGVSPFPVDIVEPDMEMMDIGKLVLQPNVEVTQADLASFLLLPTTTELYDSLSEVTITRVDFNLPRKSLLLRGICKGSNGERLFLKTIIEAKVFDDDLHVTTLLYEREEQVEASFITTAIFLPSYPEAYVRLLELEEDSETIGDSSDEEFSFNFLGRPTAESIDQDRSCDEDEDCLCLRCLNNITFGDDEEEGEEEDKEKLEDEREEDERFEEENE